MFRTRTFLSAAALLLVACLNTSGDDAQPAAVVKPTPNSADEPLAKEFALGKAATFLDNVSVSWTREKKCGACHTNYPYLMARPLLKDAPTIGAIRDFLKAAKTAFGDTWGKDNYMVTKPVTLKAMIRVCTALAREDAEPADGRQSRWEQRLAPWADMVREFREEGFYERFAAKGEVERVARVQKDLARAAGIELKKS